MATRTVRVDIPTEAEAMLSLGADVLTRHAALGINSPLTGSVVDMAIFSTVHQFAADKRTEGLDAHASGEAAIQAADQALGIGTLQTIDTPGTVYFFTGRIRSQLLLAYQGTEEEISTFGFNVVVSGSGSKKTVRVDVPKQNRPAMERLASKIAARHTALGVASPLNNTEVTSMANELQIAVDKRIEGNNFHEQAEAAMQKSNKSLGVGKGQTINTEGTVYFFLNRIRGVLLLAYQGVEEEISTFGFNVVISEGGTPPSPLLITFLTAVTDQNVLQGFSLGIRGFAGDDASILWGDGNTSDLTLDGTSQNTPHSYVTPGIYNIEQKGSHPQRIIELLITQAGLTAAVPAGNLTALEILNLEYNPLTSFTMPAGLTALNYVSFLSCALNAASINSILQIINAFGTSGGTLLLHGGTNAAPTGAGIAAKNQLENRGWAVATN